MTGDLVGTLRYMSPEQLQAKHGLLDHRTDVYSLGLTLYELLTLQPAFPGNDRHELLRQIPEHEPRPPRQLNRTIPKDLETIVLKAIAKESQSRYATAGELADDLQRFLEEKPIRARRPGPVDRAAKWIRRHGQLVAMAVVALILVSLTLGASTMLILREKGRTEAALIDSQRHRRAIERQREIADRQRKIAQQRQADAEAARKQAVKALLSVVRSVEDNRRLAGLLWATGWPEDADGVYRRSVHVWNQVGALDEAGVGIEGAYTETSLGMTCLEWGDLLWIGLGKHREAADAYRQSAAAWKQFAVKLPNALDFAYLEAAKAQRQFGTLLSETGSEDEARRVLREGLAMLDRAAKDNPNPFPGSYAHGLVRVRIHESLGDLSFSRGRREAAGKAYKEAAELHAKLLADDRSAHLPRAARFFATCPDPQIRDAARALALAREAAKLDGDKEGVQLALAAAHYCHENWQPAADAVKKLLELRSRRDPARWHYPARDEWTSGGTALPQLIAAVSHWHLGRKDEARRSYKLAVEWMDKHRPKSPLLAGFRAEAEELFGSEKGEKTDREDSTTQDTESTEKDE